MSELVSRCLALFSFSRLWDYKAKTFDQEPWQQRILAQHHWLLAKIKKLKPDSILEVGCGFGRNLGFLIKNKILAQKLSGVDISSIMLAKAKEKLAKHSVKLTKASANHLPFPNNRFELVFTHGLLMHLPPRQLGAALAELVRVSRRWLILIEETRSQPTQLNYFTWAHDYEKITQVLGVKLIERHHDKLLQDWFLFEKHDH